MERKKNTFESLGLRPELVQAVSELGYTEPTPIQSAAIPLLLEGRDVLGQAQTGTGKTAAFSLPILDQLDIQAEGVQALVIAPTRELANQVSQAMYNYGQERRIRVLPIYGGQSYSRQISRLKRGVDVVVGTPGRLLDLIRKGMLDLSHVRFVVLDEADEMLSMGFIEDIEALLDEMPEQRQTALFSATLPERIRRLAERYMHTPQPITTSPERVTVSSTTQRHYLVRQEDKLAALTRLLETETYHNVLIFTRTKLGAAELATALTGRGFQAEALHGDLAQAAREQTMRHFRADHVNILVATDVAARGLDIDDVSHVINYDIPWDQESYVHRIGRTGRAGREGIAITFVTPKERRRLRDIEAFTREPIPQHALPTPEAIQVRRDMEFLDQLADTVAEQAHARERELVEQLHAAGCDPLDIAAAAIRLARAGEAQRPIDPIAEIEEQSERRPRSHKARHTRNRRRKSRAQEAGMRRLTVNAGRQQGIRPGDIVGLIANEAGIPGRAVGAISIQAGHTLVDISEQHADQVLKALKSCHLRGSPVSILPA